MSAPAVHTPPRTAARDETHPAPAAPADAVRLTCRATGEALALHGGLEVGIGGEARVYAVPGDATRVAKVYRSPTPDQERKVEQMLTRPPLDARAAARGVRMAWPADVLLDADGGFAGYVMPRADAPRLFELYNPATRRERAPHADHAVLHRAGWNLAAAFEALHAHGYVVGDVNESNVLVADDGSVTLVDTDSLQVPGPDGAAIRCPVGRPEYTPPELQDAAFAEVDRTPLHDRFGLGVLLFQLLMEGTHPFASRLPGRDDAPPVGERIRHGWFPYRGLADLTAVPPRLALPPETLHPGLQRLFHRCFVDGHADPAARPEPGEWREALALARASLVACARNPRHQHGGHLLDCPWCDRARLLGGRDPFPAPAAEPTASPPARRAQRPNGPGRVAVAAASTLGAPAAVVAAPGAAPAGTSAATGHSPNFAPLTPPISPTIMTLARGVHAVGLDQTWAAVSLAGSVSYFAFGSGGRMLAALGALGAGLLALEEVQSLPKPRRIATYVSILLAMLLLLASFGPFVSGADGVDAVTDDERYADVVLVPARTGRAPLLLRLQHDLTFYPGGAVGMSGAAESAGPWAPSGLDDALQGELRRLLPPHLQQPDARGSVVLTLTVGEDGRVLPGTVRVRRATDAQLAGAATVAYMNAAFEPPPQRARTVVTLRLNPE